MRHCKRAVTYRSGPLRPGRSGGGAPAQEEAEMDVHLPDGLKEPRICQRTCVDGLEPALGHDVGHSLLRCPVIGRHEHLERCAALAAFGGQQLRENRVEAFT